MNNRLLSGKQVLVVEDEMLAAMLLEDMLGDLGCTAVTVAGNVRAALSSIATNVFDLATLDLNLDGTKSYGIAEALRERRIPFAFATGYSARALDEAYRGNPVLTKPYTRLQFESVIRGLLLADEMPPFA